jgi:hypothetical protein
VLTNAFHNLFRRLDNRVYPSITPESREGLHGWLEDIGPGGIRGWLLDCAASDTHLKVDVYLNGRVLGSGYADRPRPDISKILGRPISCEFLIPWSAMTLPPELEGMDQTAKLRIRVVAAESGRELHAIDGLAQTAGQLLDDAATAAAIVAASLPREIQQAEQGESPATVSQDPPYVFDGDVKAIAFYLPQFHPVPENDEWWGKGFTEWTNVTRATPQFAGHHQPQLPGELGFYDLRLDEVRVQQAQLAREYGLYGFCYYYYWFNGRRILETPLQRLLDTGTPDFPFCICWANENWTRRWDGLDNEVLLEQKHDEESDLAFIQDVLPILKDPRYIRVRGAPLLLVYRVDLLSDPLRTSAIWRQACKEAGLESLHLCSIESFGNSDPYPSGFDSAAQFPPHRLRSPLGGDTVKDLNPQFTGKIYNYEWTVADEINAPPTNYRRFRGVMTSWDNSARKGPAAHVFVNSDPGAYEVWLRGIVDATRRDLPAEERLVFINAWNEWAEGAHLEPDQKFGRAYLEATRRALRGTSNWQTLVDYANSHKEMSGAGLADWIGDVETLLKGQQLSLHHLSTLHHDQLAYPSAQAVIFYATAPVDSSSAPVRFGGHSALDNINGEMLASHVFADRKKTLRLDGWSFVEGIELGPTTPTSFIMENEDTTQRFAAILTARSKRIDVAAAFPAIPESVTAFSGFTAAADISTLNEGTYRLAVEYEMHNETIRVVFTPRIQVV